MHTKGYLKMDIIAVPFGYLMRFCYNITGNYALALIFFTLLFKLILLPLNIKQQKSTRDRARIQPKEKAIRKRYEGRTDQNAQMEMSNDLMKLYRDEKVSMTSGCLPMLIQLPIIYILYEIVRKPLQYISMLSNTTIEAVKNKIFTLFSDGILNAENTSSQIYKLFGDAAGDVSKFGIDQIQMSTVLKSNSDAFSEIFTDGLPLIPNFELFGGAMDLSIKPSFTGIMILIPILAALFQFASSFILQRIGQKPDVSTPEAAAMAKQMRMMNIIFPAMTFFISLSVPSIIGLYWIYQTIFGMIINILLTKFYPVPVFTEDEIAKIEEEMNKDYIPPVVPKHKRRSLHNIDEEEADELSESTENTENDAEGEHIEDLPSLPPRRRFDKNGNPIRSLHYIDDDTDDIAEDSENPEQSEETDDNEKSENDEN